jgi:hypothetical protein
MVRRRLSLVALTALVALGCGEAGPQMLPVTGAVRNADQSAINAEDGGRVLFIPSGSGEAATGSVAADGSFTMMTKTPGDGVKPGTYKVVLQLWKDYRANTSAVPEEYGDATTTPLEATVDADHTHFDLKVESSER